MLTGVVWFGGLVCCVGVRCSRLVVGFVGLLLIVLFLLVLCFWFLLTCCGLVDVLRRLMLFCLYVVYWCLCWCLRWDWLVLLGACACWFWLLVGFGSTFGVALCLFWAALRL